MNDYTDEQLIVLLWQLSLTRWTDGLITFEISMQTIAMNCHLHLRFYPVDIIKQSVEETTPTFQVPSVSHLDHTVPYPGTFFPQISDASQRLKKKR